MIRPREDMSTRKPHALDLKVLALEILAKSGYLGSLSRAIESFDDYQGSS